MHIMHAHGLSVMYVQITAIQIFASYYVYYMNCYKCITTAEVIESVRIMGCNVDVGL